MITVKELLEACEQQVAKGNGDKKVYISSDDEGNEFHSLFYLFTDNQDTIKDFDLWDVDDVDNIVLLG